MYAYPNIYKHRMLSACLSRYEKISQADSWSIVVVFLQVVPKNRINIYINIPARLF